MKCPNCGNNKLLVIDSRSDIDKVYRRRRCSNCQFIIYTEEVIGDINSNKISTKMSELSNEKYRNGTLA